MNRINIYELMTWQRKNPKLFPFGYFFPFNVDSLSILPSILSTLLVIIPSCIFIYSLIQNQNYDLIAFLILANISIHFFMYKSVTTNPGIIPQTLPNRQRDPQLILIPAVKYRDDDRKYLLANRNLNLYTKYCCECKIYRPPRVIHCGVCNHCVEKYDHHCPWLSVCIGKFNYRYFIGYICSLTVLTLYCSACCLYIVVDAVQKNLQVTEFIVEVLVGCLALFFGIAISRLTVYHLIIICQKRTTNEDLKKIFPAKVQLPFDHCYLQNRNPWFDSKTEYFMDKSYRSKSYKESMSKGNSALKEIMLTNMLRDLNDSTSSSSSVVHAHRYSSTATERTSVFNYLLEN